MGGAALFAHVGRVLIVLLFAGVANAVVLQPGDIVVADRFFPAAFLSGSGDLFPYLVLKSVNISLRSGNGPESASFLSDRCCHAGLRYR